MSYLFALFIGLFGLALGIVVGAIGTLWILTEPDDGPVPFDLHLHVKPTDPAEQALLAERMAREMGTHRGRPV